jgi:hypothetical protein
MDAMAAKSNAMSQLTSVKLQTHFVVAAGVNSNVSIRPWERSSRAQAGVRTNDDTPTKQSSRSAT